jgi:hypothetical protein
MNNSKHGKYSRKRNHQQCPENPEPAIQKERREGRWTITNAITNIVRLIVEIIKP